MQNQFLSIPQIPLKIFWTFPKFLDIYETTLNETGSQPSMAFFISAHFKKYQACQTSLSGLVRAAAMFHRRGTDLTRLFISEVLS